MLGDSCEQALREARVVGETDLAHQCRVCREPRDPGISSQGEDAVEIGPVREYTCRNLIEHDDLPPKITITRSVVHKCL